ncbi:3-oxoacyl-ACP synthase [Niastella yeongjuensis]|uniref:3-oxoacyl-ACP synthase n=1 Tax=Niastella yeongjuensis TaxID=354355 RepID=A0A1V9EUD0_9BACT|nr:ketoacyl-ACP synthase III [Niastella yeongjuensis]OQP49777.1 3-oxoacyl-ACP synthase [Niastella yeongjuensis]SEP40423.1 3-oxoacyl-[acyl-carrier-protein] synthase-3 [Niastella yeongjuensis]
MLRSIITGTGSYIPPVIKKNADFGNENFYTGHNKPSDVPSAIIIEKFVKITGIEERRYAPEGINTSDMAAHAAQMAINDSGIDPEVIDQIIVAHNYGDIQHNSVQSDMVPSLASRVKHKLGIKNPYCTAWDILFGCPGWVQGLIQADTALKAGNAKTCLVIGAETLSRVVDKYDRDSMIFSDGAGACIVEYKEDASNGGILNSCSRSDCAQEVDFIHFGKSYSLQSGDNTHYIKMKGRKVYEYALTHVPEAMKLCLEKSNVDIRQVKKIFIHQANEKMDEAIVNAFYGLYGQQDIPEHIMPMSIHWLGNSSVATIPTLFNLVRNGQVKDHHLYPGDVILFASVGAGMNINAICYRCV